MCLSVCLFLYTGLYTFFFGRGSGKIISPTQHFVIDMLSSLWLRVSSLSMHNIFGGTWVSCMEGRGGGVTRDGVLWLGGVRGGAGRVAARGWLITQCGSSVTQMCGGDMCGVDRCV